MTNDMKATITLAVLAAGSYLVWKATWWMLDTFGPNSLLIMIGVTFTAFIWLGIRNMYRNN